MKIWIDGDACPNKIKDILFKAAIRTQTEMIIVANHFSKIPPSPYISRMIVDAGFDMADTRIIEHVKPRDLVITADIPLAHAVVMAKALALNPRGTLYNERNIKQALAMRDFHTSLRENGMQQRGEDKLSDSDLRKFATHLDRILHQKMNLSFDIEKK